ncbi:restriction endonuclease subunit S [Kitasatospora sp. NPDC059648]|uniref:restriction endonuclease subunit S n=1 Tax=Kitasatospora sp. NPDC059648 TaxID=3346894 RepID=UPI0036D190FE
MSNHTLEDLCALIVDCKNRTPPEAPHGKGVAFAIGTPNIIDGRIRLQGAKPVTQETFETWTARAVPRVDDIVLTREAPVGRVGRVEEGMEVCLGQRTMLLRADSSVADARFLHYLLLGDVVQSTLHSHASGSTVPHLRVAQVRSLPIPAIPALGAQRAIGAVLGALDDKIAINERVAATADRLADSIFEQRTRGLRLAPMSAFMSPVLGGTPDRKVGSYWGPGVPWASAKDVASAKAGVVADTEEEITEEAAASTRAKPLPKQSVILTARGTVGAVARVMRPTAINQSCYAFPPGEISSAVLFHLVRAGSERMLSVAHGTVFSTVNMKTFDHVVIPAVEAELRSALEEVLSPLHRQIEARIEESGTLAALRDTLLPQLMAGKLRVRDAERIVEDAL